MSTAMPAAAAALGLSEHLARLSEEFLAAYSDADPFTASMFGVPGYDGAMPDLSRAGEEATAARLRDIASRAEAVPEEGLSDDERVTRAVLVHVARATCVPLEDRHVEFVLSGHVSWMGVLLVVFAYATVDGPSSEQSYLSRVRGVPLFVAQVRDRALEGVASGMVSTRRGVEKGISRLDEYLATDLDGDVFLTPVEGTSIAQEVRELVDAEIRPAMRALRDTLAADVLPTARPDERCGLLHLPDGAARYARAVAAHTTTRRTPEEIHQLGLELCASLREEFVALGRRVFGLDDFGSVVERLRTDPEIRYGSAEEILADTRAAHARAEAVAPQWFGRLPSAECTIVPMNDLIAPAAGVGEYMPPAEGRPGQFNVNTHRPESRTRFEYEALAFHESVPGHHLQFSLGQELDHLPAFRRYLYVTAFGEGWGLYTERLADEMGLYSEDLFRFGMLSYDAWRACRLVVDTGMHHLGWSRQQAVDYMLDNSAASVEDVESEIDRYIAWPGQATAYMVGRLEIERLRRLAEEQLGERFDIRAFHDAVLANGSVPLSVLESEVHRWIATVRPAS